ncbi:MAG: tail fiber domain-containing protein [Steroidobacteraceae bacterium]
MGFDALVANTEAVGNTAVGVRALRGFNWDEADRFRQQGDFNTAIGLGAMASNDTGNYNTAIGYQALSGRTGHYNTANGGNSLGNNISGGENTATGFDSLHSNDSGSRNTANGFNALGGVTTGVRNTAIGAGAGKNVVTGSDNILIGAENYGNAAQNGVIRIGRSANQKKAFVAGIRGVKTGLVAATAVFIDANGQLGTIKSSRRFKVDIQDMGSISERLLELRPVAFRYADEFDDGSKPLQFGLIAEEVAEAFPELVSHGADGRIETVGYHLLATLLLNEFQKDHDQLLAQAARIAALEQQSVELAELKLEFAKMAEAVERLDHTRMVATK